MALQGKGMMIWQLPRCEGGQAEKIAEEAQKAGFTHVLIKVANGILAYNVDNTTKRDLIPPVAEALRAKGIQVWGWHYVYGYNVSGEASIAIQRVKQLNLDGYVIDAEAEYKQPGMAAKATAFMKQVRASLPRTPIALCSYRYPRYHPELPWKEFLSYCDYNMPQMYWEQAHNPAAQLNRCIEQFHTISPFREIIPMGSMYKTGGWVPYANEMTEFLNTARTLNLKAANFYVWDQRTYLQPQWNAISAYQWQTTTTVQDIAEKLVAALNTRNPQVITSLYDPRAILITAERTSQGSSGLQNYYQKMMNELMPNGRFALTSFRGSGNTRQLTWRANSDRFQVENGNDTLGILNGKIAYHYSFYKTT